MVDVDVNRRKKESSEEVVNNQMTLGIDLVFELFFSLVKDYMST
jgi:hypothetical protein